MSVIISATIKKEDLDAIDPKHFIKGKKTLIPISIYVDDKLDNYENHVSVQLSQSKEDNQAKKPKTYLGNGRVVWTRNGTIKTYKELKSQAGGGDEPF
jgi:hypothetical protein